MFEERTLAAYGLEPKKPVFTIAAGSQRKPSTPQGGVRVSQEGWIF